MRQQKPILQIDKFSGSGENGILYCEGFYPEVDNQKSVMGEGFASGKIVDTSTTGFTTMSNILGSISLTTINSYDTNYNIYVDDETYQRIFAYQTIGSEINKGQIHVSPTTNYCRYPDLIETQLGNILFPSERYIGRGYRFKALSGSTTTIVASGINFTTLGYNANDKVTNLKTGIEYTITSINTTTTTADTLTFSANGANTTAENDEIIAWEDDRFDTNITKQAWQTRQIDWVKQFKQYGDKIYYTNGNYIGEILAAEATTTANKKQLLVKHQAIAIGVNNAKILVSATFNGRGVLLLWDGGSDGWNNSLKFSRPITALTEYQSGWAFVSNGVVYYTDGYQIQKLYSINLTKQLSDFSINPTSHNGLVIYENYLYCINGTNDINLVMPGVYAINLNNVNNGFTLIKQWRTTRTDGSPFSIFINTSFSNYQEIQVCGSFINVLRGGNYSASYFNKSLIISIPLEDQHKINKVGLNLSRYLKDYNDDVSNIKSRIIHVAIGDGDRGLISRVQTKVASTTTEITVNGTLMTNNKVGDELYINGGAVFSERTFITSIAGAGTATEVWQVSPALSANLAQSENIKMIRVKLLEKKTITYDQLKEEIIFTNPNASLLTNKLFIEIVFYSSANSMPLNINEINIYGE